MFTKFASMFHQAVEALGADQTNQQQFAAHWKAVTQYFIDTKEHKVSIEQTPLPTHLASMLDELVGEEERGEGGVAGPCMEYLLQHRILETLYALARTDCPPGMKQVVLQLVTRLLTRIHQPLLPHVHVHRPIQRVRSYYSLLSCLVQRLVRICGEVRASPAENDEIQFIVSLCSLVKTDPSLVNFFIETPKSGGAAKSSENLAPPAPVASGQGGGGEKGIGEGVREGGDGGVGGAGEGVQIRRPRNRFILLDSLLSLMHSEDARVSVKACEGLMLLASLRHAACARQILADGHLSEHLTRQLCALYANLPRVMDPGDVTGVEAKWGLDMTSTSEDRTNFPGKRPLISFLSWLDFCDQLVSVAERSVARALARDIRLRLFEQTIGAAVLHTCESDAITATAYLSRCVRLVSSDTLLTELVQSILGGMEEGVLVSPPEQEGVPSPHPIRRKLIERCDCLAEELCLTTWQLFETLLSKQHPYVLRDLVLRNLIGRGYLADPHFSMAIGRDDLCASSDNEIHETSWKGKDSLGGHIAAESGVLRHSEASAGIFKESDSAKDSNLKPALTDEAIVQQSLDLLSALDSDLNKSESVQVKEKVKKVAGDSDAYTLFELPLQGDQMVTKQLDVLSLELRGETSAEQSIVKDDELSADQSDTLLASEMLLVEKSSQMTPGEKSSQMLHGELQYLAADVLASLDSIQTPSESDSFSIDDFPKSPIEKESGRVDRGAENIVPSGDDELVRGENLVMEATGGGEESVRVGAIQHGTEGMGSGQLESTKQSTSHVKEQTRIHRVINTFLSLVPDEAKSTTLTAGDGGYECYLRDAHQQFALMSPWCQQQDWPDRPYSEVTGGAAGGSGAPPGALFFEGAFLRVLLNKISGLLHQSYELNLQVTYVASRLALLTHPNLHEFLLNPHLTPPCLAPGARTLPSVLAKVCADIRARGKSTPNFHARLQAMRQRLMGGSLSIRSLDDDVTLLAGVIVVEEFCKELAAITFVKYHARSKAQRMGGRTTDIGPASTQPGA